MQIAVPFPPSAPPFIFLKSTWFTPLTMWLACEGVPPVVSVSGFLSSSAASIPLLLQRPHLVQTSSHRRALGDEVIQSPVQFGGRRGGQGLLLGFDALTLFACHQGAYLVALPATT